MNQGPLIFLGVFAAFLTSWWGLIFAPQVQIGNEQAAATDTGVYPTPHSGLAEQGREVYVANGCVHCHSQQVRQDGFTFDLALTAVGTNLPAVTRVLSRVAPEVKVEAALTSASEENPVPLLKNVSLLDAQGGAERLKKAGATANVLFIPLGGDIGRGWGNRRTVSADYLYDNPVQIGNSRLGPDLANYGNRAPNAELILAHLYHPHATMPGSMMPAYQFLFEKKAAGKRPSANALRLSGNIAPKAGTEVVPKPEALALVAYLQSLHADKPLFEAPMTRLSPPAQPAGTNGAATNAAPNTPNK